MAKINNETVVSTQELADILGVTPRWINRLTTDGILTKIERGQYRLCKSVQNYVSESNQQKEEKKVNAYDTEKTLLTRAQREKAEIELKALKNEMYNSNEIVPVIQGLLLNVRNRLLAVPQRVAPQCTVATDLLEVEEFIKAEIYEALNELSEWSPKTLNAKGSDSDEDYEETD